MEQLLLRFDEVICGRERGVTLVLDDPAGNSYIQVSSFGEDSDLNACLFWDTGKKLYGVLSLCPTIFSAGCL